MKVLSENITYRKCFCWSTWFVKSTQEVAHSEDGKRRASPFTLSTDFASTIFQTGTQRSNSEAAALPPLWNVRADHWRHLKEDVPPDDLLESPATDCLVILSGLCRHLEMSLSCLTCEFLFHMWDSKGCHTNNLPRSLEVFSSKWTEQAGGVWLSRWALQTVLSVLEDSSWLGNLSRNLEN